MVDAALRRMPNATPDLARFKQGHVLPATSNHFGRLLPFTEFAPRRTTNEGKERSQFGVG